MKTAPKMPTVADLDFTNRSVRDELSKSFIGFCWTYLPHHFELQPARFHIELANVLEQPRFDMISIVGFRGSGKSTYSSLAFPLWAALTEQYNFIVPIADTGTQMKTNLKNIQYELENNERILADFGEQDIHSDWGVTDMILNNGVRILGRSRGQKVRGLRHKQYRPDLIIVDDPEDSMWVKKKRNRDKTDNWLSSEVVPAKRLNDAKLIVIGNMLHNDALMKRLEKSDIFTTLKYPLVKDGQIMWPSLYPDMEAVDKKRAEVRSKVIWAREYMLKVIAEEDQPVKREDIHEYDPAILDMRDEYGEAAYPVLRSGGAIDLAISQKDDSDLTAGVFGTIRKYKGEDRLLIHPDVLNKRLSFHRAQKIIKRRHDEMPTGNKMFVEDVAYQKAAIQELLRAGVTVKGVRPTRDKKARLEAAAVHIASGKVMFPRGEVDELLDQLVGFGLEEHDDMVDALVYLILNMLSRRRGGYSTNKSDKI